MNLKNSIVQKSYAKLNLFLEVTGKRQDGYHTIETVFHEISLYDIVKLSINSSDTLLIKTKTGNAQINEKDNLAYKAALKFCREFSITDEINIEIEKNIPMGAGLGGGSSNAACVLKILAEYYKKQDKQKKIAELALSLGADVPFFLIGGTAIGRGIGEELESVPNSKKYEFVLVFPGIHTPTADVYGNLKIELTNINKCDKLICNFLQEKIFDKGIFFNRLEESAFVLFPQLKQIKQELGNISSAGVLMSGSGSVIFTICSDGQGGKIIDFCKQKGYNAELVTSIFSPKGEHTWKLQK